MTGNKFIVFEGIDGSGKSTQAARAHHYLTARGLTAAFLAEPTGGEWGKKIRAMLAGGSAPSAIEQLELFIKDREDDVARNILPALARGHVIMDRYMYSNAAYQGAAGMDPLFILQRNREHGFPEPERVYLIDITTELAMQRIADRGRDKAREVFEKRPFLEKVRDNYHTLADSRFLVVDGALSENEVFSMIKSDLETLLEIPSGAAG